MAGRGSRRTARTEGRALERASADTADRIAVSLRHCASYVPNPRLRPPWAAASARGPWNRPTDGPRRVRRGAEFRFRWTAGEKRRSEAHSIHSQPTAGARRHDPGVVLHEASLRFERYAESATGGRDD